jgi:fumarylacetoacetate (FAA) hydrolase
MLETIAHGKPETPFLRFGDRVRMDMKLPDGSSVFGAINQVVRRYGGAA